MSLDASVRTVFASIPSDLSMALDSDTTRAHYCPIQVIRSRQLTLPEPRTWGGRRKGAGRKPGPRPLVRHRARPEHKRGHPVHVTFRAGRELPSLRASRCFIAVRDAIAAASGASFRVAHFSVQGDHVHLICEAPDRTALSAGIRGLAIRAARALNGALDRKGRVWADRHHRRPLATPRETRNALAYVLLNAQKHGRRISDLDPLSSAAWFDGWRDRGPAPERAPVAAPRTWLLSTGWRRLGLLDRPRAVGGRLKPG
jgi:putative transposase